MSERTQGLGTSVATFQFEGRDYTFGLITEGIMARMEQIFFDEKKAALVSSRADMDKEHYERRFDQLLDKKEKGEFSFESDAMQAHMQTIRGASQVVGLLLNASEDTVMKMMQSPIRDDLNAAFRVAFRESLPKGQKGPQVQQAKPNGKLNTFSTGASASEDAPVVVPQSEEVPGKV